MNENYFRILQSLSETFSEISQNGFPAAVLQPAIQSNSWFTEYYIQTAWTKMGNWHTEIALTQFLAHYSGFVLPPTPLRIGIIGAGNIPFVAWHDILMTVLSGNTAIVKLSRQDNHLIPYWVEKWAEKLPEIQTRIQFTEKVENPDFLIVTGSDNTARQLEYGYKDIPKIVRRHRFSVALWRGNPAELPQLCEEVLLYNGLGCRSVSVLFIPDFSFLPEIADAFRLYPESQLSQNYLEKKRFEEARLQMLNVEYTNAKTVLLVPETSPNPKGISILSVSILSQYPAFQARFSEQLQCISGKDCALGFSQNPQIDDFADGIDTFQRLIEINTSRQ